MSNLVFLFAPVPWLDLCYFSPQSTLAALGAQTIEEGNRGLGDGVQEGQKLLRIWTELGSQNRLL